MFTAASFTQSPKGRNNPLTNEWINGTQLIHTMEYYSAIKKEGSSNTTPWMSLENIMAQ